jgi:hypothetical protein
MSDPPLPDLSNLGNDRERAQALEAQHRYPGVNPAIIRNTEITLNATIRAVETFQRMGKEHPTGGQNGIAIWQYGLCLQLFDAPEMADYLSKITRDDEDSGYLQVVMKAILLLIDPDLPRSAGYDEKLLAFLARAGDNSAMVKAYMRDSGFKAAVPVFENVFRSNGDFQKLKAILS